MSHLLTDCLSVSATNATQVGGAWVEMDANVPCGESIVRQLLYGQAFFQVTLCDAELPSPARMPMINNVYALLTARVWREE